MARNDETMHSILIVSSSEKFDTIVRRSLKGYVMADSGKSAAVARRRILERYYDLVVINGPLPDEPGEQFALDVVQQCNASVLLVIPAEIYDDVLEHVTDHGILVLSKPFPVGRLDKAIRYLGAVQNKVHRLEKKILTVEEKMEEIRIVSRAKIVLIEREHMTEDDAHRYIGKQAMDSGVSRKRIAEKILEDSSFEV